MGSFLTGDTTELDSEIILECQQRGLAYNIIRVGRIIDDVETLPKDVRRRSDLDNAVIQVSGIFFHSIPQNCKNIGYLIFKI